MSLYNLVKAGLLLTNAIVIINERFLRQIGWAQPQNDPQSLDLSNNLHQNQHDQQQPNALISLLTDNKVKLVIQIPLIILNIIFIFFEMLLG